MLSKSTDFKQPAQPCRVIAGILPGDHNTELIGVRETRRVYAITNGNTVPFANLHPVLKAEINKKYRSDVVALFDLRHLPEDEALEEYAFCLYGTADHNPDFDALGNAGQPENFVCGASCRCLKWETKSITLAGKPITERQLQVIQHLATDEPDKVVADKLCIAPATLDSHKRKIFRHAGVSSITGLVRMAMDEMILV